MRLLPIALTFLLAVSPVGAEWSLDLAMNPSTPVEDEEIHHLVDNAIDWYGRNYGLNVNFPTPQIKYTSRGHMLAMWRRSTGRDPGGKIIALYIHNPRDRGRFSTLYLDRETFDKTNPRHRSIASHEAFHHVQFMNNLQDRVKCHGALEDAAYTAQAWWMVEQGHMDAEYIRFLRRAASLFRCR